MLLTVVFSACGLSAEQASPNYSIETDVLSGGGGECNSTGYYLWHTTGQPTAIGISSSTNYLNYAGFQYTIAPCDISFSDVPPGFWAEKYIEALYCSGITTGYADNTYRPSENVNRAQMAAFIIRAKFGEDFSYSPTQHFSDISDTHWAFKYVQKMYDEGITTGYDDGTYQPSQNVTRAQMAAFIVRAKFGESFTYTPTPYFTDIPNTHWAFKYIQKMRDEGITTGYTDNTYRPTINVNRTQMATFIGRAFLWMP